MPDIKPSETKGAEPFRAAQTTSSPGPDKRNAFESKRDEIQTAQGAVPWTLPRFGPMPRFIPRAVPRQGPYPYVMPREGAEDAYQRCMDAAKGSSSEWTNFCTASRWFAPVDKTRSARCHRMQFASRQEKMNFCAGEFGDYIDSDGSAQLRSPGRLASER